jgi:hypothetical protein
MSVELVFFWSEHQRRGIIARCCCSRRLSIPKLWRTAEYSASRETL